MRIWTISLILLWVVISVPIVYIGTSDPNPLVGLISIFIVTYGLGSVFGLVWLIGMYVIDKVVKS